MIEVNQCTQKENEEVAKGPEQLMFPNCNIVGLDKDASQLIEGKVKK